MNRWIEMDERGDFKRRKIDISLERVVEEVVEKEVVKEEEQEEEESDSETSDTVIISFCEESESEEELCKERKELPKEDAQIPYYPKAIGKDALEENLWVSPWDIVFQISRPEPMQVIDNDEKKEEEVSPNPNPQEKLEEEKDSPVKILVDSVYDRYEWLFSDTGDYITSFLGKAR